MMLSDVCLSVCRVHRPKSRSERPRKTKIGTEVVHVTRDSDTTFKIKRSKVKVTRPLCSPPCWRVGRLQRWAWEHFGREKLLLRCRLMGGSRRPREERGGGISWRPPAYSLLQCIQNKITKYTMHAYFKYMYMKYCTGRVHYMSRPI